MANSLFIEYKQALLEGGSNIALNSGDIRTILIDHADDTPNPAAAGDDFLDDITAPARVSTLAATMTTLSVANNVFDADDATHSSVTGDVAESVIIYKHTGVESTSRLVCFLDTLTGLPVTPGGGNITVQWHASGIFSL